MQLVYVQATERNEMDSITTNTTIPIAIDEDGVVRVGGTRVTLDVLVHAFTEGATAEEIAQQYPTVSLADVYATIAYFLSHRGEVERYLARRRREADDVRRLNEMQFDPNGIRARLLARRTTEQS